MLREFSDDKNGIISNEFCMNFAIEHCKLKFQEIEQYRRRFNKKD